MASSSWMTSDSRSTAVGVDRLDLEREELLVLDGRADEHLLFTTEFLG
jgi:hypothetical protein